MKPSSNNNRIPKEQLSAYQRWELNSFETPPATDAAVAVAAAAAAQQQAKSKAAAAAAAAAKAMEKTQSIHKQAYESGHADGLREGAAKATEDAGRLGAILDSIKKQSAEIKQELTDDLLALALEIARQMVRQSLSVRPELVLHVVQDALLRVAQPLAPAIMTLNPADAAIVRQHLAEALTAGGWQISEDPGVARGGCVLQTNACHIDATVDTRWQRIANALGQDHTWTE